MNRAGAALTVIATFLVPVSCNSSLSRSSKVVRVSGVTLYGFLLILIVRGIVCLGGTKKLLTSWYNAFTEEGMAANAANAPETFMKNGVNFSYMQILRKDL
ncbi:hypothetical protein KRR40_14855 [Niabella defluvii]|nr:hypothetical protein KRR40_14855 [Niabella sp. I65]